MRDYIEVFKQYEIVIYGRQSNEYRKPRFSQFVGKDDTVRIYRAKLYEAIRAA